MLLASIYTATLACLLLGCLISALATEPSHDALDESLFGDLPRVPDNLKSVFHSTQLVSGGQRNHDAQS